MAKVSNYSELNGSVKAVVWGDEDTWRAEVSNYSELNGSVKCSGCYSSCSSSRNVSNYSELNGSVKPEFLNDQDVIGASKFPTIPNSMAR